MGGIPIGIGPGGGMEGGPQCTGSDPGLVAAKLFADSGSRLSQVGATQRAVHRWVVIHELFAPGP